MKQKTPKKPTQTKCIHDWDYCGSFRMCKTCYKTEDVLDGSMLNYEKSGLHLAWHKGGGAKYMTGEYNKNDS